MAKKVSSKKGASKASTVSRGQRENARFLERGFACLFRARRRGDY